MDEKQIRGALGDAIAHVKERLSFARPKDLSVEQCESVLKAIARLEAELPPLRELPEIIPEVTFPKEPVAIGDQLPGDVKDLNDEKLRKHLDERRRTLKIND